MRDFFSEADIKAKQDYVRTRLMQNIGMSRMQLLQQTNTTFIEKGFRDVKLDPSDKNMKMGVFYIDGYHSYEDTRDAMIWGEQYYSDEAIVIVDDLHLQQVERAVLDQVYAGKYRILLYGIGAPSSDIYD
jgi:hypothetical protein